MDVVALHQSGVTKVVATLGTATTTEHLKTLNFTNWGILLFNSG
jgi:DNA primase